MKEFIKNNKEILIAFFCIWIGIIFTLTLIKLSNIEKRLSSIDDISSEIRSSYLGDISFHLKDISSELNAISKQSKADALFREINR